MKLAYITTCFGTPSHTFIRRELRELARRGYDVELLGIRRDTAAASDAADLVERTSYLYPIRWPATLGLSLRFLFKVPGVYLSCLADALGSAEDTFKNRLKLVYHLIVCAPHAQRLIDRGISHLHAHFMHVPTSIAMFSARLAGIPFSVTVHSAGERGLPELAGLSVKLKRADHLIMISHYNIDYYGAVQPVADKSSVIRCGMEIDHYQPRPFVDTVSTPMRLLAVGRFVEKKGFAYLIDAAKILRDAGFPFKLEIIGSGPMLGDLIERVRAAALGDVVALPGHTPSEAVREKMLAADLVVVPSVTSVSGEMEGIPVVIMEAMASGVPVLATAHSGIPELVNDDTGCLVPERDAAALAEVIQGFEPSEAKVRAARRLIEQQFAIEGVVDQRLAIFADDLTR